MFHLSNILFAANSDINALFASIRFEASPNLLSTGIASVGPTSISNNNPLPVTVVFPNPLLDTPTTPKLLYEGCGTFIRGLT